MPLNPFSEIISLMTVLSALKTVISEIISENGFSGMQDMGNVMKELKIKHSNAEMSEASSFVKELLS